MGAKVGLAFIALWTLIQAIGYGAMTLLAILAHNCNIKMNDTRLVHFMYAIYFRDNACGPLNWNLLLGETPAQLPIMADVTDVAWRTNILIIIYFALSCFWLLASLFLFVSTTISCCSRVCFGSFLWTWLAATTLVTLMDLTASGFFTWDIVESIEMNRFLAHFGITLPEGVSIIGIPTYMLPVPSIILLAVSVRGIVFWIFNVVLIFVGRSLGNRIVLDHYNSEFAQIVRPSLDDASDTNRPTPYANNNVETSYKQEIYPPQARPMVQSRYEDPAPQQMDDPSSYYTPPQQPRVIVAPRFDRPPSPTKDYYPLSERRYFEPLKTGPSSSPPPTKSALISGGDQLDQQRISIDRPHLRSSKPQPPPVMPKPVRDSMAKAAAAAAAVAASAPDGEQRLSGNGGQQHQHNAQPPDELRGQLPWSYFKNRNDVSGPKKTFTQLREDEDLPPVPVPDYTLHFPRKDRPSTNSSDEGAWTGPEQRY